MQPRSPSPDVVDDPAQSAEAGSEVVDVGLEREVAKLIVEALNLEIAPEAIDPQDPLFGDGLGLDSIDILEVAWSPRTTGSSFGRTTTTMSASSSRCAASASTSGAIA
jgi:aryl carrier-like protein